MLKKLYITFISSYIILSLLVACDRDTSSTSTAGVQVHMNSTQFVQTAVTIKKGQSITLVADGFVPHTIANGTWINGTAKPLREQGAPLVKDVQINGNSTGTIGPFTTAGTFKLYCTIHVHMNLSVIVQ